MIGQVIDVLQFLSSGKHWWRSPHGDGWRANAYETYSQCYWHSPWVSCEYSVKGTLHDVRFWSMCEISIDTWTKCANLITSREDFTLWSRWSWFPWWFPNLGIIVWTRGNLSSGNILPHLFEKSQCSFVFKESWWPQVFVIDCHQRDILSVESTIPGDWES